MEKINYRFISLLVILFLYGCTFFSPITPANTSNCGKTQTHLEQLNCDTRIPGKDQIKGTEDDPTWEQWCIWVQESNIDTLDLECILKSNSCDIERCYGK